MQGPLNVKYYQSYTSLNIYILLFMFLHRNVVIL